MGYSTQHVNESNIQNMKDQIYISWHMNSVSSFNHLNIQQKFQDKVESSIKHIRLN